MLLLESVMKNKEYEEIKEHFLKQNQKNQNFYDISKLYWYQVNDGHRPVVSLAYKHDTENGVVFIDYKTKDTISQNVIQHFATVFIFPYHVRCYIEDFSLQPKGAEHDCFLVKGYYKTRLYDHAGVEVYYKFKDGVYLIRQNGNLKTINARAGDAKIVPRRRLIQTHGEEIIGIAFSEKILDKCVRRVNNKILVRYLKFSKDTQPIMKEENAQKTETEQDRQM